jgi:hypothetical protein
MHVLFGLYKSETIEPEHIGISPAREGWIVANGNMMCLVAALAQCISFGRCHLQIGSDDELDLYLERPLCETDPEHA